MTMMEQIFQIDIKHIFAEFDSYSEDDSPVSGRKPALDYYDSRRDFNFDRNRKDQVHYKGKYGKNISDDE